MEHVNDVLQLKTLSALVIFIVALLAGAYPFFHRWLRWTADLSGGQALSSGVFLGAGLIHMLGDANNRFVSLHYDYPFALMIAGVTFLFFLALEHIGRELHDHHQEHSNGFALTAFFMLSIHSLFAGAAFGLSQHLSILILLFIAIISHKWAASFALATKIVDSQLKRKVGIGLFFMFTTMTPLGILFGHLIITSFHHHPLIEPIFNAIAAGTFLYIGTLHGLARSFMVEKCCNLKNFTYVIVGFSIMAVVAIWT